jgi:hypothetical protein
MLVRIVSDWDSSGLLRQTPGGAGMWDGICFTTRAVEECDLLVMSNNRKLGPGLATAIHIPGYRWPRWRHRLRYLHRKIRAGEAADLVNVLINKAKYIWWSDV